MPVNSKSSEFLSQVLRSSRKDLRLTEDLLISTPKESAAHRTIADQVDDQKLNMERLKKARKMPRKQERTP
jgi:hypothetical protein